MPFNTEIRLPGGIIILDATTSINPLYPSKVTEHHIEDGSSIADHVILNNIKLEIEGVVTDAASLSKTILVKTTTKEAFQKLVRARENREIVSVVTSLTTFENMIIVNFSFPRDNTTGGALNINISFEQISIVSSSFVQELPIVFSDDIADDATPTTNIGVQQTTPVPDEVSTSVLTDLISSVSGQ